MYNEFVKLISTVGFPIAVSVYLLVKIEKRLDDMNKSFLQLTKAMQTVIENQKK